jgi:hypothetical protein
VLKVLVEARAVVAKQPLSSALILTYVRNMHFDGAIVSAFGESAKLDKPHVKAAAVVGLSGLHTVVFNTIRLVTRRTFGVFDDLDTAKDWLVSQ